MIIYKTVNLVSGKFYIGKDMSERDNYLGSGVKLKDAIKKYGRENFKKEVICKCENYELLNALESFLIFYYDACNPFIGYNMTSGGDGGPVNINHPNKLEIYERIRKANTGKNHFTRRMSKEEYDRYIENKRSKNSGENHWSKKLNKEEYEEYRKQQSLKSAGKKHARSKKIKVISPTKEVFYCYGDFKNKMTELNNGNPGLYLYLLTKLHNKKISNKSKYNGWIATYE